MTSRKYSNCCYYILCQYMFILATRLLKFIYICCSIGDFMLPPLTRTTRPTLPLQQTSVGSFVSDKDFYSLTSEICRMLTPVLILLTYWTCLLTKLLCMTSWEMSVNAKILIFCYQSFLDTSWHPTSSHRCNFSSFVVMRYWYQFVWKTNLEREYKYYIGERGIFYVHTVL